MTPIKIEFPKGTIALNAVPWAEVWVDGEKVGETPIGNLSLSHRSARNRVPSSRTRRAASRRDGHAQDAGPPQRRPEEKMKSLSSRRPDRCGLRHRPADGGGRRGAGSGDLAAARDLYASAAYDDALAVLNRLRVDGPSGQPGARHRAVPRVLPARARPRADAEQAIEAVVAAEPSYLAERQRRVAARPIRVHHRPPTDAADIIQQQYARRRPRSIARNGRSPPTGSTGARPHSPIRTSRPRPSSRRWST